MEEEIFRDYFVGWKDDKYYADASTTTRRLEAAGFEEVETWLHDEVAAFDSVDELARFLGTVVLGGHLERLPEEEARFFRGGGGGEGGGGGRQARPRLRSLEHHGEEDSVTVGEAVRAGGVGLR